LSNPACDTAKSGRLRAYLFGDGRKSGCHVSLSSEWRPHIIDGDIFANVEVDQHT